MAPKQQEPRSEQSPSSLRRALDSRASAEENLNPPTRGGSTAAEIGRVAQDEAEASGAISLLRPSNFDRAVFCRQFAMLIEVGFPVLKALQMLAKRTHHRRLRAAVAETAEAVERGETIHQAMSRNKAIFSPLVVNIIRVGEVGGMLESSLLRLADIMEAKARIRRKIASASMYPIVALCVALGVITLVLVEAVPRFASIYQESGQTLPKPTQFVINLSNFLVGGWWILLILIVALLLAGRLWTATTAGNRFFSWLALNTPGLSGVNRKIAVARSTRTLGELIAAGFPLTDALLITAQTNENAIVADALRDVHAHVEQGERMTEPLAQARVFPPMVVDMISIGEETGTLDRMLLKIAEIYDAEVETALNGLATIIEPLLIVLMGCVVIFIALAVLLPYFNLVNVVAM